MTHHPDNDSDQSRSYRALRLISIIPFFASLPICIVHGVITGIAVPALGVLPLLASSIFGFLLRPDRIRLTNSETPKTAWEIFKNLLKHPFTVFIVDTTLSAVYILILVLTWDISGRGTSTGQGMLAAYATVGLLINFFIHTHLALAKLNLISRLWAIVRYLTPRSTSKVDCYTTCPNCQQSLLRQDRSASPPPRHGVMSAGLAGDNQPILVDVEANIDSPTRAGVQRMVQVLRRDDSRDEETDFDIVDELQSGVTKPT